MNLNIEWKKLRNTANTENVLMTISDIVKFYKRGRIDINPSYQRAYRWTNEQKTKFIESLLLKYPIPPIITIKTENESGLYNYEIIDGVQRLSTIFEFVGAVPKKTGIAVDNKNEKLEKLEGANEFIALNGQDWNDFQETEFDFIFESSTLLFINLTTENEDVKYEMFERLNTLQTDLSPQEVRNSIIALKDRTKYISISTQIDKLSKNIFSQPDLSKRIDMEYFVEFSLIKRYDEYIPKIEGKIAQVIRSKSKDKNKHFDLLLTSFVRIVKIEELLEDIDDYRKFIDLNKGLDFKKYDTIKENTVGSSIKFFFELLSFLYFKEPNLDIKEIYRVNFYDTYGTIRKEKLNKSNINARSRFELAEKIISEYKDGYKLF